MRRIGIIWGTVNILPDYIVDKFLYSRFRIMFFCFHDQVPTRVYSDGRLQSLFEFPEIIKFPYRLFLPARSFLPIFFLKICQVIGVCLLKSVVCILITGRHKWGEGEGKKFNAKQFVRSSIGDTTRNTFQRILRKYVRSDFRNHFCRRVADFEDLDFEHNDGGEYLDETRCRA